MNNPYNLWPIWIQKEVLYRLNINEWSQIIHLKPSKKSYLETIINKYHGNIPLTKIIGIKYFYDYKLINHDVLDPRYDSEIILDVFEYLDNINYKPYKVLELGGGSGCLSIACHKKFYNDVFIGELNVNSIKTLQRNLKMNKTPANIIKTNWWNNITGKYDVLITNPPYLSLKEMINGHYKNTYDEPIMALYGGIDGLSDYRTILKNVKNYINDWIILEICHYKFNAIKNIVLENNLSIEKIFYDLNNKIRMILIKFV